MITSTLICRLLDPLPRVGTTTLAVGLLLAGCDQDPTRHNTDVPEVTAATPASSSASTAEVSTMNLPLPFSGTVNSSETAFLIEQGGTGRNAYFRITNSSNYGAAVAGNTNGGGAALNALNSGLGPGAVITASNPLNTSPALQVSSWSLGVFGSASALLATTYNTSSIRPTAYVRNYGKGTALNVNHKGTAGELATFQVNDVNKIRFSRTGRGYFNGGTQLGGADVAEAFAVEGSVRAYEPGDVLTISKASDRTVEKSDEPYSSRVVGVYATKPGVLLTERDIDASLDDMIPLGVIGVIPTKVSAENGAIRRGDLLVTAQTPGHVMAPDPRRLHFGMVLGKALEAFPGPGTGTIRVLVNVK